MRALTLALAVLALPGCEAAAPPAAPVASAAPAAQPFPAAPTAYSARLKAYDDGVERELTVYADAGRIRLDGAPPPSLGSSRAISVVFDPAAGKAFAFRSGQGAPKIAILVEPAQLGAAGVLLGLGKAGAHAIGADQALGSPCEVWRFEPGEAAESRQVCITPEGIVLRVTATAAPTNVLLQAQTVTRGPQAPALFALPAGYELIDFGPCTAIASEAMVSAHAGHPADKRELAACESLAAKASRIFAGP